MRRSPFFLVVISLFVVSPGLAQRVTLPNGWSLSPHGRSLPLGDLPLNVALSPNGRYVAVTNNGQSRQSIQLFDAKAERLLHEQPIRKAWVGLSFGSDGRLYASGGNDNVVRIYDVVEDRLRPADSIAIGRPWPVRVSVAGLALAPDAKTLYAVTKDDSALYVCDVAGRSVRQRLPLPAEGYTCLAAPKRSELYVSVWGADQVLVYDTRTMTVLGSIPTGSRPGDLALSPDGRTLYVACANDNSVSVIDVARRRVAESLNTALYPGSPAGSTPNSVALTNNGRTLLVANADNNCLAVFDVARAGRSQSRGFIPTGWYPTVVRVAGGQVLVANGKGFASAPNPKGPNPYRGRGSDTQYIGSMFKGTLSVFPLPNAVEQARLTKQVYANVPYRPTQVQQAGAVAPEPSPVPRRVGGPSPIRYVFYIVKENRTYDQVFGDMPEGNGDTSLCLFPERVTPNHHALARQFGLLDNFYVDAEVSADGHNWSTAAYANDYVEKTWPTSYGGRGGTYDYEGSRPIAFPKKGFIWDYCRRAGLSYRSYGEFAAYSRQPNAALRGMMCPKYPDYDLRIKDVDRVEVWKRDFDSLVAAGAVPRFSTIRLGNDHTAGARVGQRTPEAYVADNDLALGRLVEHLSNSPIWKEAAVFVLEDDAQNGPDHVDAHRSPALVISPYSKRGVNHTPYTTSGMLRTMELLLGLPPMSQYDAAARPMFACFQNTPDAAPYQHRPANIDLDVRNTAWTEPARQSERIDLRYADRENDRLFNEIIWRAVKGEHVPVPAPRRSAFVQPVEAEDED